MQIPFVFVILFFVFGGADIFRSDIREGKPGTPLALTVKVVNVSGGCAPVTGANVEIWQCDAAGSYSEYGSERSQTYLRGVQTTNASGEATFTTIYPGWYPGRTTHIHFKVHLSAQTEAAWELGIPPVSTKRRTLIFFSRRRKVNTLLSWTRNPQANQSCP